VAGAVDGHGLAWLVPPGDTLSRQRLEHLGQRRAQLLDRESVLEERHRATVDDDDHERDRRDLHRLGDGG